jgi:hypothetical protein
MKTFTRDLTVNPQDNYQHCHGPVIKYNFVGIFLEKAKTVITAGNYLQEIKFLFYIFIN